MNSDSGLFLFVEDPAAWADDWIRRHPGGMCVRLTPELKSRQDLFTLFARELNFPCYFGENWDAFEECLRDLSWLAEENPIALVHEISPLARAPEDRELYLTILQEAIQARRDAGAAPELLAVFDRNEPLNESFFPRERGT